MENLKIKIVIKSLILASILSLIFLLTKKRFLALGILLGAFTGIVCFQLLARDVFGSLSVDLQKIKPYFFLKYLLRYVIMGVTLFACAKIGLHFFISAAIGLLLIYLAVFVEGFSDAKSRPNNY